LAHNAAYEIGSLEILLWFAEAIAQSLGNFWVIKKEWICHSTICLFCSLVDGGSDHVG